MPRLGTRQQQSLGELDVQLLVFLVFQVVVPTDLARLHSATSAVVVACSAQPRLGAAGTVVSM